MPLFRTRNAKLLQSLTSGMRLLLPEDPGPDRMLDAVRQFRPEAGLYGDRIFLEAVQAADVRLGRAFGVHLSKAFPVDAGLGREAQLPADITVAYLPNWILPGPQYGTDVFKQKYKDLERAGIATYRNEATYLLGGLAARFGGIAAPWPDEVSGPLQASVYTPGPLAAAQVAALVSRCAPGLQPDPAAPGAPGAVVLRRDGAPFEVECGSAGAASRHLMAENLKGSTVMTAGQGGTSAQGVLVVRAAQLAGAADPGAGRAVGEAALALAAGTGGVCLDLFGFRVSRPEDLVIR